MLLLLLACTGTPADDKPGPDESADTAAVDTGDTGDTGEEPGVGSVEEANAIISGAAAYAVGNAVAFAGDDDGDGHDAALIGASFLGRTCLFRGPIAPGGAALEDADACWLPENDRDYAGQALDGGRDVTGDGVPDFIVGAIANDELGPEAGKAYVVAGPYTGGALADAPLHLLGESKSDYAGTSVALLGDVDGDGGGDLLVGAPANEGGGSGAGRVYLLRGPMEPGTWGLGEAWATITGEGPMLLHGAPAEGDGVGSVACAAGDVDGDGLADVLLGANGNELGGNDAGAAAIFLGPVGEGDHALAEADRLWIGDAPLQYVGDAVAAAGDLDGDGLDDVLVSGDTNGPGTVWVVAGSDAGAGGATSIGATAIRFEGENVGDLAGAAAAGAGDTDGDGWRDLVVGAYGRDVGDDADVGAAYLVRGPFAPGVNSLGSAARAWYGRGPSDNAGRAVAGGGDLDGDALGDLLVGAPYADTQGDAGGAFGGEVYLFLSR